VSTEPVDPAPQQASGHPALHLPAAASVGDRRGLTAFGAVAIALTMGLVGGAWDVVTGPGLREVFAVCFVLGCGVAALTVHREDLRTAVVMPPLVYVALALIGGLVERAGDPGSLITRQAVELVNALVLGAPVLLSATALALLVALGRTAAGRRPTAGGPPATGS
jgi:hypothetical protein